ncbi:MAG TPA: hypothetical protein VGY99_07965 [Candidatus Binataceae bacterium]|jgi:hypothetical protein|nr:hypothetical protein [Candidatus Binataceae bacterium]
MKISATAYLIRFRGAVAVAAALFALLARPHPVLAQNAPAPNAQQSTTATSTTTATGAQSTATTLTAPQSTNPIVEYFLDWFPRVTRIQSEQPHWVTPLVTVTPRLEEEVRYDQFFQSLAHGKTTDNYGGGKGLELIPFQNTEVILGFPAWISHGGTKVHGTKKKIAPSDGWADETFLVKYRLLSANEEKGNYILTAFMGFSAPTGDAANSNGHAIFTPTIAGGKGWGNFDVQSTLGVSFPLGGEDRLGMPLVSNTAFQYRVYRYFWPEFEVNYTWWPNGARTGINQVFLTPGLLIGRIPLHDRIGLTFGAGYQVAVTHQPQYNHSVILTARIPF